MQDSISLELSQYLLPTTGHVAKGEVGVDIEYIKAEAILLME